MSEETRRLLESVYATLQEVEVKGERNCALIAGISRTIKAHVQKEEKKGEPQNDSNA